MTIRVSIPRNPPTLGLPAIIQQLNSKTATDEDRRAIFSLTFHLTKTHCIWNSSNFLFQRSSFCFCCLFSSLCNSAALRICGSVWTRAHTNTDVQGKTSTKHESLPSIGLFACVGVVFVNSAFILVLFSRMRTIFAERRFHRRQFSNVFCVLFSSKPHRKEIKWPL